MYEFLKSKMAFHNIETKDIQRIINVTAATISRKLSGESSFKFDECVIISRDLFNDQYDLKELFKR